MGGKRKPTGRPRGGERRPAAPTKLSHAALAWWGTLDNTARRDMLKRARAKWGPLTPRALIHLAFTKLPENPIDEV